MTVHCASYVFTGELVQLIMLRRRENRLMYIYACAAIRADCNT